MKIKEILEATNGELLIGNIDNECDNFCKDTRIIKQGDTYVGIKGENFDGNTLWKKAFESGANTVIISGINIEKDEILEFRDKNIILVKDTIEAIGNIARCKRNKYGKMFPVIGVTGSVGKTSTKDIISNVVAQKYKTLKTQGNLNNQIGLPFTLFNLTDHEAAVIEMGMNQKGEISYLSKIAKPTISVITNVGTSHIGNLGSRENILKAKLEILDGMENKVLIINNDNDLLHKFYLENLDDNIKIYTYGIENESDFMARNISLETNSSKFTCKYQEKEIEIKVPVGGIHFVYNALSALAVGAILGLNSEEIQNGISSFELTKKRMDILELKNGVTIINDSYNASFESMQASLKYLGSIQNKRKIAILGDMFELGEFSEELHKKVGKEVVKNNINILICNGENSKNIIKAAKENGMKNEDIYYFETKEEIISFVKRIWKQDDEILIKASNGMKFYEISEELSKI